MIKKLADSDCGKKDGESYARLPQDWIAVFHYPERGTLDDSCPSVIDRMQKALMFGASAIIILTLNQDILKEMEHLQWISQGSILGPLLFLIFINDIISDIQSTIKLFADDTSLYLIVDDPRESANNLNSDLAKIHRWSSDWLVTFNPQKTETMTISRKLHKPDHPKLNMDNVTVTE
ncbi:hypothetical protein AM593_07631, partial [Mytilus galloprovincialis]